MRKSLIPALLSVFFLALPVGFAQSAPAKRPMTFDDMMHMKRLGDTAVSPDGKWLVYSVTTVDLAQNTRTAELWIQKIDGGDAVKLAMTKPGDSGAQFSADGKRMQLRPRRGRHGQQGEGADLYSSSLPALESLHRRQEVASVFGLG